MSKEVVRNINININGKEVVNSMSGITKALRETNRDLRNLNKNDADYTEQLKKHRDRITELKARQAEFKNEIYDTSKAIKESTKEINSSSFSIQNFMSSLTSGDFEGVHEEFKNLGNGIGNVTKQALLFIATPIGATIAVLAGIAAVTKIWYDYNTEMEQSLKITKQFTGLAGEELEAVGVKVNGIVERTGASQKEVLTAVQALVKDFGLSYDQAFAKINLGYERAGASAEDFFDNTAEYSPFLAQAGYSADEFFAIMQAGAENGVYKDKILDSIKEVDLRLKEMPASASEALTNAFGQNFTDTISRGVKTGEISTKQALELITKEADKTGLNFQQKGQLIADVFSAAGEDAGGFEKVIASINSGLDKVGAGLTEVEQAQMDSVAAQDEMNQAFADLFHTSDGGFSVMKAQLMEGVYKGITYIINGVIDVYNWFVNLYNSSSAFAGTMNTIGAIGKMVFNNLMMGIKNIGNGFKGIGSIIEAVFKGDFSAIPTIWKDTMNNIKDTTIATAKESAKNFVDAWNGENPKLKTIERNVVDNVSTNNTVTNTTGNNNGGNGKSKEQLQAEKKAAEAFKKGEEEIDKLLQDSLNKREALRLDGFEKEKQQIETKYAQLFEKYKTHATRLKDLESARDAEIAAARAEGEAEIDEIVKSSQEQIELSKLKGIAREEASITNKYAKEIEKFKGHTEKLKELEAQRDAEIQALKDANRLTSLEQANNIETENTILKAELEAELEAEKIANFEERALFMLQRQQEIAELELEIERNKVLEKARINGASAEEIAAINANFDLKKEKSQRDFAKAEEKLNNDKVKWTELTEEQKLNSIKGALSSAAEAFNEGSTAWKAAKIAETTITTYQSATSAFNSLANIPIVGTVLGAAAAALAVASGLKNIQKISQTPLQKMPTSHFYGGFTGDEDKNLGGDKYGAYTGYVHANEWVSPAVMTQSPRYAPIINWLDNERQMMLNGGSSGNSNPLIDTSVLVTLATAVNHLNEVLSSGIEARTNFGYEEVEKMQNLQKELNQTKQNAIISNGN